jgi:hypothetical protein
MAVIYDFQTGKPLGIGESPVLNELIKALERAQLTISSAEDHGGARTITADGKDGGVFITFVAPRRQP